MTPEQKELKVEAFRALLDNRNQTFLGTFGDKPDVWINVGPVTNAEAWLNNDFLIRLAPPAEIPWHNPEGVTQEQLMKGWRFLLVDEIPSFNPLSLLHWCGGKNNRWGPIGYGGTFDPRLTYCTDAPLPAKYQHLVPESEEARARRLFAGVKQKAGYGPFEFEGMGPVKAPSENEILANYDPDEKNWRVDIGFNGQCEDYYYARARKLPTEKEKAEAALNAYKLEPGERLVLRGLGWECEHTCDILICSSPSFVVVRRNKEVALGNELYYYAEIIKEPEMVPWDINSCPVDGYFRDNRFADSSRKMVMVCRVKRGVILAANEISVEPTYFVTWRELFEHYEFSEAIGTTWTRAGKGVGA